MKAYNLLGHKNQFMITDYDASYFQSYDTLMCKVVAGDLGDTLTMLDNYWSATTGKHMKEFLEETYMLDIVLDLIYKHKIFKGDITVEYKNTKGESVEFTCKAP